MEKKNFNLTVATFAFIAGAFFVLANKKDITANVIGLSGPGATISAITGIILIIASSGFFVFTINHGDYHLERLVRETKDHTTVSGSEYKDIKGEMAAQEDKEKYEHE